MRGGRIGARAVVLKFRGPKCGRVCISGTLGTRGTVRSLWTFRESNETDRNLFCDGAMDGTRSRVQGTNMSILQLKTQQWCRLRSNDQLPQMRSAAPESEGKQARSQTESKSMYCVVCTTFVFIFSRRPLTWFIVQRQLYVAAFSSLTVHTALTG